MFDAATLVTCLHYWWSEGQPVAWGGGNPPAEPLVNANPPRRASIKWWCDHIQVGADGGQIPADLLDYGHNGFAITPAYQVAVAEGWVLSERFGQPRWFVLHPDLDEAAYAAARRVILAAGHEIPLHWPPPTPQ
jgi:hypothetical protein